MGFKDAETISRDQNILLISTEFKIQEGCKFWLKSVHDSILSNMLFLILAQTGQNKQFLNLIYVFKTIEI